MAKRTREFEGVEHTDVVRLSSRRERRKSLTEWVKDCHNDPADVLKPYFGLAVIALLLSWAPFWPELLAIGAVFLWSWVNYKALTSGKKRGQSRARSTRAKVRPQGAQAREALGNSARSAPAQKTHAGGTSVARKMPPFREAIVVFCHKCGNRLAPGSAFCNRCGAQVIGTVPRQDRQ